MTALGAHAKMSVKPTCKLMQQKNWYPLLMKNPLALLASAMLLACFPIFAQTSHALSAKLDSETAGISSYRLANGFKIILVPYPSASNARVELLVKSGSKYEGYGETGMAHLLEHMLFKGAGKRKNIKDDLTKLGAAFNGTTTADRTNFYETVVADPLKVDELIRIEADRFIRSAFTANDLASEMTVVRNELENTERVPSRVVMAALSKNIYRWHGYSRATIGARSDIEATTYTELKKFHSKHYRPDNAALIVSGNFDKQRVLKLATDLFQVAKNPNSNTPNNWTVDSPQASTNKSEIYLSTGTTVVASAWKIPSLKNRDIHALDLAAASICDPDWGSLRKDIVLEKKLAVSATCYSWPEADYSRFIVSASAGKDADAQRITDAVLAHIEASVKQGVTQEQLERARKTELNQLDRLFDSHDVVASLLSDYETAGDWRLLFWVQDVVNTVSLEEANQSLRKWLTPTNRSDVLLRDSDSIKPLNFPSVVNANELVNAKLWVNKLVSADPAPKSFSELVNSTTRIALDGQNSEASLIKRKTQGDKVFLHLENDYGNFESLSNRKAACNAAGSLIKYGGNGFDRDTLDAKMESLQAVWQLGLSGISLEVPAKNFEDAFLTLLKVWTDPNLPVPEFERYKSLQISSYEASLKNPIDVSHNRLRKRFDNFPDGHWSKTLSYDAAIEELKSLTYSEVQRCAKDFAHVSHVRIGIVGDINEEKVKSVWRSAGLSANTKFPYARIQNPSAPKEVDTSMIKVSMPDSTNAKVTGVTVVPVRRSSEDFVALHLAVEAMGGNSSSIVWMQLREKAGLAYQTGVLISPSVFDDRTTIQFFATSASSNADQSLGQLTTAISRVLADGFSTEEINRAKEIWLEERKTYLGFERNFAPTLSQSMYDGYGYAEMAVTDQKIKQLSAEDVTKIFRKYIKPEQIVWAVGRGN